MGGIAERIISNLVNRAKGLDDIYDLAVAGNNLWYSSFSSIASAINDMEALSMVVYDINNKIDDDDVASVFDNVNLSTAKGATLFDRSDLIASKCASIFDNANMTVVKCASILGNTNLSVSKVASILDDTNLTSSKAASILDDTSLTITRIASILDDTNLTSSKAASIFNETALTVARCTSIFNETALTVAKLQSILDSTNLTIQKGQEIVDAMASPSRIDTGGRRGVIGDDWDDNKLTSRDNAATTATSLDKIVQNFRQVWTNTYGTPSASGGNLVLPVGNSDIQITEINNTVDAGTFQCDAQYVTGITTGGYYLLSILNGSAGYSTYWSSTEYSLQEYGAGTRIVESVAPDTSVHAIKFTRDSSGNFELFRDGVSKGTVADTNTTTFPKLTMRNSADAEVYVDNLEVY